MHNSQTGYRICIPFVPTTFYTYTRGVRQVLYHSERRFTILPDKTKNLRIRESMCFDNLDLCITFKPGIGFAFCLFPQLSIHILELYVKSHVIRNGSSRFCPPKQKNLCLRVWKSRFFISTPYHINWMIQFGLSSTLSMLEVLQFVVDDLLLRQPLLISALQPLPVLWLSFAYDSRSL